MKEPIIMPKMGESITEGTIVKWFKKQGSFVKRNENVVLISTDKVEAEIPSSSEGVLAEIIAKEGETLTVGSILGHIELSSHAGVPHKNMRNKIEESKDNAVKKSGHMLLNAHENEEVKKKNTILKVKETHTKKKPQNENVFILIKNIVSKYGINLQKLINTKNMSKSKKIYKSNILKLIKLKYIPIVVKAGSKTPEKKYTINPISRFRSVIMKNMLTSRKTSAHVSTFFKVNYSNIRDYKKIYNIQNKKSSLTYTSFIAFATVKALKKHPYINSEINGNRIITKEFINLGVAVSINYPEPGILVPVISNADQLNLLGLSEQIKYYSILARNRGISLDNLVNGTFTITNPGQFGAIIGVPIINQPQVAILAIGSINDEAIVLSSSSQDKSICISPIGWLCLSFDHRLIDGVTADLFMSDVKAILENWPSYI
jgi:2-oxoglutarate dehydrogenase E2 component (dihydrolipoamide succinyltransferase)